MHGAGFTHGDYFLRNIVLDTALGAPHFHVLDCPNAGMSRRTGILKSGALEDLAQLDAGASLVAACTDRLRFVLAYAGAPRLTADLKKAVRNILAREKAYLARERLRLGHAPSDV